MPDKYWDSKIQPLVEGFKVLLKAQKTFEEANEKIEKMRRKRLVLQRKIKSLTGDERCDAEPEFREVTRQLNDAANTRDYNMYEAYGDYVRGVIRDNPEESLEVLKELQLKEIHIASQTDRSQTPPQSPIYTENVPVSHLNLDAEDTQLFEDEANTTSIMTEMPVSSAQYSGKATVS